jgi:hypothetical protein
VSSLPPYARLGAVVALVVLVLGGGAYLLFLRGGDDGPVVEAGSRFGSEDAAGGGGSVLDTLAPVLGARQRTRSSGADPAPPSAGEVQRAPSDAVAGLFVVGFAGTAPEGTFFTRLRARPYGGVLLGSSNYVEPSQLAKLTASPRTPTTRRRSSPPSRRAATSTSSATSPPPAKPSSAGARPLRSAAAPAWPASSSRRWGSA